MLRLAALLFSLLAFGAGAQGGYIQLKAWLAQLLLEQAWQQTLLSAQPQKPWPWADTWPVARLSLPESGQSMIVLEGGSGEAMAFGPARLAGRLADRPGDPHAEVYVIGGHRDTHLSFLGSLLQSDGPGQEAFASGTPPEFEIQNREGQRQRFVWSRHFIANADRDRLAISAGQSALVLITCYPFNAAQTGGPQRFVVIAEPVQSPGDSSNTASKG